MKLARSLGRKILLLAVASSTAALGCAGGESNDEGTPPPAAEGAVPVVEAVRITDKQQTAVAGELSGAALAYVRTYDAELGMSGLDEFEVRKVRDGVNEHRHVRMRQLHEGVPVWGAGVVVHSQAGRYLGLNGTLAKHLGALDVNASVTADEAMSIGKSIYTEDTDAVSQLAYSRESSELVVYPLGSGRDFRLAWHVVFFTERQGGADPGLWNYFVDAHTGDVINQFNGIHTLEQASGPGGNDKVARTWDAELDVEPQGDQFAMETARLVTVNMNNSTSGSGTVVVGPLDSIGDAALNDAHGFAEQTLNMLSEWYGHDSIDDNGFVIRSRVHYDVQYENAFWDGEQMTYGDGASTFFPLSGDIDVVSHEINHGFTTFHSDLIYQSQSGGMNESFSDIAGTIAEFFDEGDSADFDLGTDIFRGDTALRFMCDPTADGASIDHLDDYFEGLDVHFSSGIMNKAFCRFSRRLASGDPDGAATQAAVRRAGEVFYEANASFWTQSSTFVQGCEGTIQAATALGFSTDEIAALNTSWQDVGVFCDGSAPPITCDETFTEDSGTVSSPNFPDNYGDNFSRTYCIQPASGAAATLHFDAFNTEANFDFVRVRDAAGTELSSTSGATAPADATSTLIAITFTSDQSVTAPGWSASWTTEGGGDDGGDGTDDGSDDGTDDGTDDGADDGSDDGGDGGGGWSGSDAPNLATVDNGSACTTLTVAGDGDAALAQLDIEGQHDWRSVLRGTLEHNGTVVDAFGAGTFDDQAGAFGFTDRAVPGLSGSAAGEWTLCVIDTDAFGDTGVLGSWSVHD